MDTRRSNVFRYLAALVNQREMSDTQSTHKQIENQDLCDYIIAAAESLPPAEKLVFNLRDVQDFSVEEVAEISGMSVGSVKTNLCYARKRIRTALARMNEGVRL